MQQVLIGGYALEAELGRGAAGVVYRARDPRSGRPVALKLLTGGSRTALRRFQTEAHALQRLDHQHLVRVLDSGEDAGRPFLVMELVDGSSLAARVGQGGPLAPREAATIARDLARALEHAHARGVIHRDIKPANVLLDRSGRARLGDFGLARELDGLASRVTMEGAVLGTPGYLPPEQVRGELDRIDARADVYALGATLFALLTGEAPFAAEAVGDVLEQTVRARAPAPSERRAAVDPGLDAIVLRCLEKSPERRYSSATALAADLERWLRGERPAALQGGSSHGRLHPALRRGALPALMLLSLALGLAQRVHGARERDLTARLEEARGWASARVWSRSEAAAARALELAPTSAEALALRLRALTWQGETERAVVDAHRLLELAPQDPDALAAAASASLLDLELRERTIQRGLELAPRHARLLLERSELRRYHHRDLDGALADLLRAAELAPDDDEVLAALTWLHDQRGELPQAVAVARRALQTHPGRGDLWEELGLLLERLGDLEGALDAWWRGSHLGFYRACWWLCERSLAQGRDLPRLEGHLGGWLARRDEPILRTYRGRVRTALGDTAGAEEDFSLALVLDPRHANAAVLRGLLRHQRRAYDLAEADFDLAWRLESTPVYLANRGACRLQLGRLQEAEADLRLAAELDPGIHLAQVELGNVLHRLGRTDEALERYLRAVEVGPDRSSGYEGAARLLGEAGRLDEALAVLAKAQARFSPGDPRREAVDQQARRLAALRTPEPGPR